MLDRSIDTDCYRKLRRWNDEPQRAYVLAIGWRLACWRSRTDYQSCCPIGPYLAREPFLAGICSVASYDQVQRFRPVKQGGLSLILSDSQILTMLKNGSLVIHPLEDPEVQIQPASVDLRLDNTFMVMRHSSIPFIDPQQDVPAHYMEERRLYAGDQECFIIHPGEFVLASTIERVQLPDNLVGRVDGRSSLGRLGLQMHSTAGFVDPGFSGTSRWRCPTSVACPSVSIRACGCARSVSRRWPNRRRDPMGTHCEDQVSGAVWPAAEPRRPGPGASMSGEQGRTSTRGPQAIRRRDRSEALLLDRARASAGQVRGVCGAANGWLLTLRSWDRESGRWY
jgi:deoxycytidine triphosphate deaminase